MPLKSRASFCIVSTTYSKGKVGSRIVEALLAARLAACVQVLPIRSFYTWKGKRVNDSEHLMLIKAKSSDFEEIKGTILKHHDYEVPEVIAVGIDQGSTGYLKWLAKVTK
jgi:periplasmic divalent cation tolerance protein